MIKDDFFPINGVHACFCWWFPCLYPAEYQGVFANYEAMVAAPGDGIFHLFISYIVQSLLVLTVLWPVWPPIGPIGPQAIKL
jgi:hypothetical protein